MRWGCLTALTIGLLLSLTQASSAAPEEPKVVQIGVVKTVFSGIPKSLVKLISRPLKVLMKNQTGLEGEVQLVDSPEELGKKLRNNEIQLGVMHGFELGWARSTAPDLKPLVIAIRQHVRLKACLVVHKNSEVTTCTGLRGKKMGIPRKSREHCRLWLARRCVEACTSPNVFFASVSSPTHPETALDEVVSGSLDAAVVEKEALDTFREKKATRAAQLRLLDESEPFPAGVIVYHPGHLPEKTLERFRKGMLSADKTAKSRRLLKMTRITRFLDIPTDFEKMLSDIMKAYPPVVKK